MLAVADGDAAEALVQLLFPVLGEVRIDGVEPQGSSVRIDAHTWVESVSCPRCSTPSTHVHSRYDRTLTDLAIGGRHMTVRLRVRRFRCREKYCEQKIFAEQVPGLQCRTNPLTRLLGRVGLALGGRAGARMTCDLAADSSRSTLLRLIRSLPVPEPGALPVIGVDDFATRKGHVYGTVIVDWPPASRWICSPIARWKPSPRGSMSTRKCGWCAVTAAAPTPRRPAKSTPAAIQVADRWHLFHNLSKAVEKAIRDQYVPGEVARGDGRPVVADRPRYRSGPVVGRVAPERRPVSPSCSPRCRPRRGSTDRDLCRSRSG
ncbi:hypothetical protein GFY24_39390 [Nocardia sp. SYP-A9097]|nr:hypothetical protein [Nocardia sp. SYP-A9097]